MTSADPMILRLMTWLSPSFPIGAFAYSGGLETIAQGNIHGDLEDWLETLLTCGPLRNDAILLNAAMKSEDTDTNLSALTLAMATSPERHDELRDLGTSFQRAAVPWMPDWHNSPERLAYPVAVGALARHHHMETLLVLQAFLHATLVNQIQVGQRLLPIGQAAAMAMLADLEPEILHHAHAITTLTLDDLGSAAFLMDHAALNHATLTSRIFRS
ncbi:MAG: urease accessory UreF family protein [Pseudomonadota bacterium]